MSSVRFDEDFEIDFNPIIHAKLRSEIHQRLKSTSKIVVFERIDESQTKKVNSINLNTKFGQYPPDSVDTICEAVAAIMHNAWLTQEPDDPEGGLPPMSFVIVCEHWQQKASGKPKRARSQFSYTYHDQESTAYEEITVGSESPHERIIELQNAHILQLQSMLYEGHQTLMESVRNFGEGATAGAQIMRDAIPLFIAGMQSQLNAAMMSYSDKKAEREAAEHGKHLGDMLRMVMPYAGVLSGQLLGKFAGIDPSAFSTVAGQQAKAASGQDFPDDDDDPPASPAPDETVYETTASESERSSVGDTGPAPDGNELAQFAWAFGNQLRPDQHQRFNEILTKKQVGAFYDLFCADSDDAAYAAYMKLMAVAAAKVGDLNAVLDDQQREWFSHFMKKAAEYGQRA